MNILYHYCTATTFHSIVASKSIWLSSLSQFNDSMEGKLASEAVERLATSDKLDSETTKRIQDAVSRVENSVDGLGFCMSEEGDLLSQWRGYADDGAGVAIGFSMEYLDWMVAPNRGKKNGMILERVEYEPEAHNRLVDGEYRRVMQTIENENPGDDPRVCKARVYLGNR
jgi:hypothetical protein